MMKPVLENANMRIMSPPLLNSFQSFAMFCNAVPTFSFLCPSQRISFFLSLFLSFSILFFPFVFVLFFLACCAAGGGNGRVFSFPLESFVVMSVERDASNASSLHLFLLLVVVACGLVLCVVDAVVPIVVRVDVGGSCVVEDFKGGSSICNGCGGVPIQYFLQFV